MTGNSNVTNYFQKASPIPNSAKAPTKVKNKAGVARGINYDNSPQWNYCEFLLKNEVGLWSADQNCNIYKWVDTHWKYINPKDGEKVITSFIHTYFPNKASGRIASDTWKYTSAFFADNHLLSSDDKTLIIPCANGYLHAQDNGSFIFKKSDKSYGIKYHINVKIDCKFDERYDIKQVPEDSLFGKYLATSLPDLEFRNFIQEQCALTLYNVYSQIAFWWYGTGGNGKGVMTKLISALHKDVASINLHKLDEPTELAKCLSASLLVTPEVGQGKWCEEEWKALIGGDMVSGKLLYKDPIDFSNSSVHIISSNSAPFYTDASNGVERRLCACEWTTQAGAFEAIPDLDKRIIEEEFNVFLDWVLEGYNRIVKRGGFLKEQDWPESVRNAKRSIKQDNNCIQGWANQLNVRPSDSKSTKESIYQSYHSWCLENDKEPLKKELFWRKIWNFPMFASAKPRTERGDTIRLSNGKQVNAVFLKVHGYDAPTETYNKEIDIDFSLEF